MTMAEPRWKHEGVEQPWNVGEAIGVAWRRLWARPLKLVLGTLVMLLVSPGLTLATRYGLPRLLHTSSRDPRVFWSLLCIAPVALGLTAVLTTWLVRAALAAVRKEPVGHRAGGLRETAQIFLWILLYPLLAIVSLPAFAIPALGIALAPFWMVDRGLPVGTALRASWRATRGHKGALWLYNLAGLPIFFLGVTAGGVGICLAIAMYWVGLAYVYVRLTGRAEPETQPPELSARSLRYLLRTTLFVLVVAFAASILAVARLPVLRGSVFSVTDMLVRVVAIVLGVGVVVTFMATMLPVVLDLLEGHRGSLRSRRVWSGALLLVLGLGVAAGAYLLAVPKGAPWVVAAAAGAVGLLRLVQGLRTRGTERGGTSRFTLFVGARHIRARKSGFLTVISILSIMGVAISSCSLSTVVSVMGGFSSDLKRKILGNNAHIVVDTAAKTPFLGWGEAIENISKVPGVVGATPVVSSEVMVYSSSNLAGVIVRGVDPETIGQVIELPRNLEVGKFDYLVHPEKLQKLPPDEVIGIGPTGELYTKGADLTLLKDDLDPIVLQSLDTRLPLHPGIIVGRELSKTLRVYVGDEVTLVSPLGDLGPMGVMPRTKKFRVAAIFFSGMYEYDASHVYVQLDVAQEYFDVEKGITAIDVKVEDAERADQLTPAVTAAVGRPELRVRDWREMNKNLFSALKLERLATFVILSIAILVASFCIICTLLLMVTEKGKEIAILKALGATDGQILRTFVTEGMIVGAIGTVFGVATGLALCMGLTWFGLRLDPNVYYIDRLPIHVEPSDFFAVAMAALVICTLATLYPAWAASKVRPVEGLRYE